MSTTSYWTREKMGAMAKQGRTDREIGQQLGCSMHTVRKWRRRLQKNGPSVLVSRMGRPKRGPLSHFPVEMRAQLSRWVQAHPQWGAKTLHTELSLHPAFAGQALPSWSSLARWRKASDQARAYEKHSQLPQPPPRSASACHEEWELDARGTG